jgi:hypothetical protein
LLFFDFDFDLDFDFDSGESGFYERTFDSTI